jgi:hypothetical protein
VATIPAIMPEHGPRKTAKSPETLIDDAMKGELVFCCSLRQRLRASMRLRLAAAAHLETPHAALGAMGDCLLLI